jgi:hypothetical protein
MASTPMILQRLGSRERRLIGLVLAILLVAGTVAAHLYLESVIVEMEEGLDEGVIVLEEIELSARDYLDSLSKKKALEAAIQKNDPRIQTAIDSIAKKVEVTQITGADNEQTSFDKVLRYEAKTTERPVLLGDRKKKSRDKSSEYMELSQPTEYSFVRFSDLMTFLEQIESPDHLMFVPKLVVTRKYMDPEFVQGQLTIATFIYKPQQKGEEEEVEE